MKKLYLSIVVPVYQGELYLAKLIEELEETRVYIQRNIPSLSLIECIFVIDECKDNSQRLLQSFKKTNNWIHVIELSKNSGQHAATVAGILHSSGDWIITIDEDLQHRPKNIIPILKTCLKSNSDICYAHSIKKIHSSLVRDKITMSFKKIIAYLSSNPHVQKFSSFRCIRGSIARGAAATFGVDGYFDVTLSWFTDKIVSTKLEMEDIRNKYSSNKSGYSIWSLVKHGKRLILSSKLKFLRLIILAGMLAFLISIFYSFWVILQLFLGNNLEIRGWTSTIISIYFFGGLSCLFLGIIIETISEILLKSKGKPAFFVVDRSTDIILKEALKDESL